MTSKADLETALRDMEEKRDLALELIRYHERMSTQWKDRALGHREEREQWKKRADTLLAEVDALDEKPLRKIIVERMWRHDEQAAENPRGWYGEVYSLHYGFSFFKWSLGAELEHVNDPRQTYVCAALGPFYLIGIKTWRS